MGKCLIVSDVEDEVKMNSNEKKKKKKEMRDDPSSLRSPPGRWEEGKEKSTFTHYRHTLHQGCHAFIQRVCRLSCCGDDPDTFCAHSLQSVWLNVIFCHREAPLFLCWVHVMHRNLTGFYRILYGSPIGPNHFFFYTPHGCMAVQ